MKIIEEMNHHRNDFTAWYECEFCGHRVKSYGYSDWNFYHNVVPNRVCGVCKKSTNNPTTETDA